MSEPGAEERFAGFDHLDTRVADLRAVEPFYDVLCPALGLVEKHYALVRGDNWQFGVPPGEHNAVEYHERVAGAPPCFIGVIEDPQHVATGTRIAFRVATRAQVERWIVRLPTLGARRVEPSADMHAYPAVFFEDPSGTKLEICARNAPAST